MTQDLMAVVNAPYRDIETYRNLNDTLKKAVVGISFWGNRYIYAEGYKGYCPLVDLYRRIYQLAKKDNPKGNLNHSLEEAAIGKEIVLQVTRLSKELAFPSCTNKIIIAGTAIHIIRLLDFIKQDQPMVKLIANILIIVGIVSYVLFISKGIKDGLLYGPTWHWHNNTELSNKLFNN